MSSCYCGWLATGECTRDRPFKFNEESVKETLSQFKTKRKRERAVKLIRELEQYICYWYFLPHYTSSIGSRGYKLFGLSPYNLSLKLLGLR